MAARAAGSEGSEGADSGTETGKGAGARRARGSGPASGSGSASGSSAGSGSATDDVSALLSAVQRVLARVDAHAARPADSPTARPGDGSPGAADTADALPPLSTLATLTSCFGLSDFERQLVLLTAAAELEPTTGARCAAASGDPQRAYPTFSLALAALAEPHWSALTPLAPLRRWRLVELDDETRLTTSRLRLDERVLHFLLGSPYLDARLHGMLRRCPVPEQLPSSYEQSADRVASGWAAGSRADAPLLVELVGGDLRSRADIAAAAAARSGLGLYAMAAGDVPADAAERDRLARLWQREAVLLPSALLLETGELDREQRAAAESFVSGAGVPLVVSGDDPRPTDRPRGERVSVPRLGDEEQLGLWAGAFDGVPELSEHQLRALVAQFQLPPHVIRSAAASVRRDLPRQEGADAAGLAWQAGLTEARLSMDDLGRRIEPGAGWDDLVLADRQVRVLREIIAHVRQRATVHQEWGFAGTLRRGLGVTALFAGGSGTGKTLAAEVVAKELGLDLFVIDLSQVVSKYIGETEKNLRKVFDAAERGGALLLFDEADALFGKRSEVKDSHDRYANLEVSYLLMRMEAYRGLAVLTTNMKKALDSAFLRRIRFVVDFPFPAESERAEIWRRVLPPQAPVKDIDTALLARLTVAGGSIRNIALSGAFLAAEEGDRLQMRHMLAAAKTEYLKLERSLTPSEVRGWV
ncbi:AAA ATPase central domain-containing protein [Streptomyces albus]|uniref:AAA ATPase central domain-containing protein n=1 Tax=Streptomyces albus (strain ATCC 21838 / DSM 41398 / FERM P-419 / JCM 4703 / NBRC 107858) TaxID=1081613 RepID=A0A0B5ETS6_STRA4|nr:AAA ATPase central domain-containing protein [Streptomyces albus]AOU79406.1 AAA ATPase central domain-containing protein [Streptomyces albus]AYN35133.1 ATP-binding protein [Streptomyces albus]